MDRYVVICRCSVVCTVEIVIAEVDIYSQLHQLRLDWQDVNELPMENLTG